MTDREKEAFIGGIEFAFIREIDSRKDGKRE
jgi:hypothetical protein